MTSFEGVLAHLQQLCRVCGIFGSMKRGFSWSKGIFCFMQKDDKIVSRRRLNEFRGAKLAKLFWNALCRWHWDQERGLVRGADFLQE